MNLIDRAYHRYRRITGRFCKFYCRRCSGMITRKANGL